MHAAQFTAFDEVDWDAFARMTYRDKDGRPARDYDPALADTLAGVELEKPMPSLWDEFRALAALRMLVLRGQNSDLLSAETVAAMAEAHPGLACMTVADQGHAPLLRHGSVLNRIGAFIAGVEGDEPSAEAVVPRAPPEFSLDTSG